MDSDSRLKTVSPPLVRQEIVQFPPEVDLTNADAVGARLLASLRPGVAVVIADMTSTSFCDSSGIRQLVIAHSRANRILAQLRVVTACPPVLRVLHLTGLDQVLDIRPSIDAAMANCGPDERAAVGC